MALNAPKAPQVECEMLHPTLYVPNITAAVDFYEKKLGFLVAFTLGDPPDMAGVNMGDVQMFLEKGIPAPQGCSVYFVVGNADELFEFHRDAGVEIVRPPEDQTYELRDYLVRDLNGYHLFFGQRLYSAGEPISVASTPRPAARRSRRR